MNDLSVYIFREITVNITVLVGAPLFMVFDDDSHTLFLNLLNILQQGKFNLPKTV